MKHGGDLSQAAQLFGRADGNWLDLSTGINPNAYPFTMPDREAWQVLPQSGALDRLLDVARSAYGADGGSAIVAAPGTQMLIQMLPLVRPAARVAIVEPTYNEHAQCWRGCGADIQPLAELSCPKDAEIVVVVNPNNPDGRIWPPEQILSCAADMAKRGGVLVVDEAFADVLPEMSVVPHMGSGDGLIVLRSFGKFFGLAGARLGFAIGAGAVIERINERLGPWAVSGPAIDIGIQALQDRAWQEATRESCRRLASQLDEMLSQAGFEILGGTSLYRLTSHPDASAIHRQLAAQGIWVRRFDERPNWLRFGLPGNPAAFEKLAAALV